MSMHRVNLPPLLAYVCAVLHFAGVHRKEEEEEEEKTPD